jgi:(E)-4-hydroxy-3-methylbut-2-enyl-diphosphate synthase
MLKTDLITFRKPQSGKRVEEGRMRTYKDGHSPRGYMQDNTLFQKRDWRTPIGDIHFNHKIAIKAMESGIDAIRINPGTINNVRKVKEIALLARETKTPIRIGFNIGSIEKRILKKHGKPNADGMVESALYYTKLFEDMGWTELKISLKASDIFQTIDAYKKFSAKSDYPFTSA